MRNLRKTRKRGGLQYEPNFYVCEMDVPVTDCITNFAAANNFMVVRTLDDGNCFYDTLSKYGAYSGNVRLNNPHMALRREIIDTMILNQAAYAPYFVEDKTVSPEGKAIEVNVGKELRKFLRSKQWAGWMGDVIPQVAADILGVNIVIYDVLPSNTIDRITIHPVAGAAATTVNMLRTNGSHFELLWPGPAVAPAVAPASPRRVSARKLSPARKVSPARRRHPVVAPGPNASRNMTKKANVINNLAKSMKNARFNNNTRKRSSSLENALKAIANQERAEAAALAIAVKKAEAAKRVEAKKAEAVKKAAAKKAKAAANEEQEALALQMALEASIRNLKIKNNNNK